MRKLIAILTLLLFTACSSCAHAPRGGDLRKTRDSANKVEVTLKLDLKPLNDWYAKKEEEARKREEARKKEEEERKRQEDEKKAREEYCKKYPCFGHPWMALGAANIKLSVAQQATEFHVISVSPSRDTAVIGWSGTGWVAAKDAGKSYVMTAGHVCESSDFYPVEVYDIDWDTWTITFETINLPIIEKHHVMVTRDGVTTSDASIIRDEDMDDGFNGNDLCMLGIGADLGPAVSVATDDPEYGDTCSVVGAPTGLWGGGIAIPSEALFAGRGSLFGTEPDGLVFNGLLAPGNSGSAVVCDGKAVGVISLGSLRFRSTIHAVPWDAIRKFARKALHRK